MTKQALLLPLVCIIAGCSPTPISLKPNDQCLKEKTQCEEIAIDKAIKDGIVQEQLLNALGTDNSSTHIKDSCYQRYLACKQQDPPT